MSKSQKITRTRLGWLMLALGCCLFFILAWYDARLKHGEGWGFVPEDAQVQLVVPDLPGSWRSFQDTQTAATMRSTLSRQLHEVPLYFRQATGIRPTPQRVSVWLGQQALVGMRLDGESTPHWGICVRPGILLRVAHALNRMSGAAPVGDVFPFRDWHYAWRGGYLIASPDQEYVYGALQAEPLKPPAPVNAPDAMAFWQGANPGRLTLHPDEALTFEGELRAVLPGLPKGNTLNGFSQSTQGALLTFSGASPEMYIQWLADAARPWHHPVLLPALKITEPWREAWLNFENFSKVEVDAFSFRLYDFKIEKALPLPEWSLTLHTEAPQQEHPLLPVFKQDAGVPYAWNSDAGVLLPMLGTAWTFALQGKNYVWHIASQEAVMQHLLSTGDSTATPEADIALLLDWKKLGVSGYALAVYAAEREMLPWNMQEMPGIVQPWASFLMECGHFELYAKISKEHVVLRGQLNARDEAP